MWLVLHNVLVIDVSLLNQVCPYQPLSLLSLFLSRSVSLCLPLSSHFSSLIPPTTLSQYITLLMEWVERRINDEDIFPPSPGRLPHQRAISWCLAHSTFSLHPPLFILLSSSSSLSVSRLSWCVSLYLCLCLSLTPLSSSLVPFSIPLFFSYTPSSSSSYSITL